MQREYIGAARLAALCLGSSIFALSPAMASSFPVGGGTITTTDTDAAADLTGSGGPFLLKPNTTTTGDVVTITGVSITNTDNSVTGRAIDAGGTNTTTGSYSVTAHGNTLTGNTAAGLWMQSAGGTISFDSSGGAANHISGTQGIAAINTAGGNVSIKTGADIVTTSGAFANEVLYGTTTGSGTISIDSAGATLTGGGSYGISAVTGGSGAITIGGNGGIASSIKVANGYGIYASSVSSAINVTLANTGSITALNGMYLQGGAVTVDSFGTITATNSAINASNASSLFLTLEDGSMTRGSIIGTSGDDTVKLVTGANTVALIGGATFDGGGGTNRVILTGSGMGAFDTGMGQNFAMIEKDGSGTWGLSHAGPGIEGATIFLNGGSIQAARDAVAGNVISAAGTSLQFNIDTSQTYTGVISGGASVSKAGRGELILTGNNTYTGGTTILDNGRLTLGAENALPVGGAVALQDDAILDLHGFSQSIGPLSGSSATSQLGLSGAQLTTTSAIETNLSSRLFGSGTFVKAGTGTLTLFGSGSSTPGLTIKVVGGRLNMSGLQPASAVSVSSGASLGGVGSIGSISIASGGTLRPGVSPLSTMRVTGDVVLASGATYVSDITSAGIGSMQVGGTASLNGSSLIANLGTGTYSVGQRFTLISAAGGVDGTFSSFSTSGVPGVFKSAVSYDANDVYLTLSPNALSPLLATNATSNQHAVADGIDAALAGGATLPGGFMALFGLSGSALGGALNQLTGEIGGSASRSASQALSPYLALLMRTGNGNSGDARTATVGVPGDVKPAQLRAGATRIWAAAYGGHSKFNTDAITGAQQLSTGATGLAIGIETQVSDDLLIGGSVAGAGESFSLAGGMSQGISSDIMGGIYMREALLEYGYLSGALVYGSHNVGTQRATTISGTDILKGKFVADDFGGRLEGGYGFGLEDGFGLTPYAAFAGENFSSPAYSETALSGTSIFALSYTAGETGLVHSELGARVGRDFGLGPDSLSAEFHAAWAHQIQDDLLSQARFQNLAGSTFAVAGAALPEDSGLLGLGLTLTSSAGISGGAKVESRFGAGFTAVSGSVSIGYSW